MSAISVYSKNFENVLQSVHDEMKNKMEAQKLANEAKELQNMLYIIKTSTNKLINDNDFAVSEIGKQTADFFEGVLEQQNLNRTRKFSNANKLFRRGSRTKTSKEADNIFEDDLDALFSYIAGEGPSAHLTGNETANISAIENITKDIENDILNRINKAAKSAGSKYRAKQLKADLSQKTDIKGYSGKITIEKEFPGIDTQRLVSLLQDATFTAKQYTSYRKDADPEEFSSIGLKLGQTNLYKAIMGSLSSIYSNVADQKKVFFRGLSIITYPDKKHSATPEFVSLHFTHLRFIYELRGEGLLDKNGDLAIAKYIIYNDPNSDAIFVRDTASIIVEEMERKTSNLFGVIHLSASKVNSNR